MPSSIIQGVPLNAVDGYDMITETQKVTAGYFTDGGTSLIPSQIYTGSVADDNEIYYYNIAHLPETSASAETQFAVAFGHYAGSGSDGKLSDNNDIYAPAEAIYKRWTNVLLAENKITGGFFISTNEHNNPTNKALADGAIDESVYVLVGQRARMKDRINRKNWTIAFSGSNSTGSGVGLTLTDDSATVKAISTIAGPRYNIVSGSSGTVSGSGKDDRVFGWLYPDQGVMVFSGAELSASIPGGPSFGSTVLAGELTASLNSFHYSASTALATDISLGDMLQLVSASTTHTLVVSGNVPTNAGFTGSIKWPGAKSVAMGSIHITSSLGTLTSNITSSFHKASAHIHSSSGFASNLDNIGNPNNALRFISCLQHSTSSNAASVLTFRNEEDQNSTSYFCRIKGAQGNFSTSPTFVSGSHNELRHQTMWGNPSTFITGVQLYDGGGNVVAVGSLSKPLRKNFFSEATIKVKLTY